MADDFEGLGRWSGVLTGLLAGRPLSVAEAEVVMDEVFSGQATPAQIAALLIALRAKGETVEEMTGFVRVDARPRRAACGRGRRGRRCRHRR